MKTVKTEELHYDYINEHPDFTGILIDIFDQTFWVKNGKYHREDGPAVDGALGVEWWIKGKLHREDGPAIVFKDGHGEWFLHGKNMSEEDHKRWVRLKKLEGFLIEDN